jgi:hypothetical protein
MSEALLGVYRNIGEDRYVSARELPPESGAFGRAAWEIYDRQFGRFTGAALDPDLGRFNRPDVRFGRPLFPSGRTIVVLPAAPLAGGELEALRNVRANVVLLANPEGLVSLQSEGLGTDLLLVERTRVGDRSMARGLEPGPGCGVLLDPASEVTAWERRGAPRWLARSTYSWGVWPASGVATALAGGATSIALLGSRREGSRASRDRESSDALLALLARIPDIRFVDFEGESTRPGWHSGDWTHLNAARGSGPRIEWRDEGGFDSVVSGAISDVRRVAAILPEAQRALALAQRARAGASIPDRELTRTIETVLAWGSDACLRRTLQCALGLTFLPRLWRSGISMTSPERLWRPLMLSLRELTMQAQRLESRLLSHVRDAGPRGLADQAASAGSVAGTREAARGLRRARDESRVSVIVPVVDRHAHVAAAVRSVLAQTYSNLEVLVVYGPGVGEACEAVKALGDQRVQLVACTGGLAQAMNVGIGTASGGFIALHGADDLSHPERLARQVGYLDSHPDIAVVATATTVVDEDGSPIPLASEATTVPDTWTPEAIERQLLFGRCFEPGSVLARRRVIEWAGGYRARLANAPDMDLWLRLLPTSRFAKLPTRLHARRVVSTTLEDMGGASTPSAPWGTGNDRC